MTTAPLTTLPRRFSAVAALRPYLQEQTYG